MGRRVRTEGPDMGDVYIILQEMERLHGANIRVEIRPMPGKYSYGFRVEMVFSHPSLVSTGQHWKRSCVRHYPSPDHRTLEGLLYAMALWGDRLCSKELWLNGELPF